MLTCRKEMPMTTANATFDDRELDALCRVLRGLDSNPPSPVSARLLLHVSRSCAPEPPDDELEMAEVAALERAVRKLQEAQRATMEPARPAPPERPETPIEFFGRFAGEIAELRLRMLFPECEAADAIDRMDAAATQHALQSMEFLSLAESSARMAVVLLRKPACRCGGGVA